MPEILINGKEYVLPDGVTIIGRGDEADIKMDSTKLSRMHARFIVKDDTVSIEDLGSKNGSIVNDEKIADKQELKSGDVIRLADVECKMPGEKPSSGSAAPKAKSKRLVVQREAGEGSRKMLVPVVSAIVAVLILVVIIGV